MKRIIIFSACALILTSCSRSCEKMDREFESGERRYEVEMYSGGDTVFHDKFDGIVNNSEGSDGCYYHKGDTLIEISGDYVLKSVE